MIILNISSTIVVRPTINKTIQKQEESRKVQKACEMCIYCPKAIEHPK